MCEALRKIMAEDLRDAENRGVEQGIEQGIDIFIEISWKIMSRKIRSLRE
jgi:hypothetical protein